MKKGFVISIDALIALVLLLSMLAAATAYYGGIKFEAGSSLALKQVASDSITVLEKSGKLEEAVNTDSVSDIRAFLNRLPGNICGEVSIYSKSGLENPLLLSLRPGCSKNFLDMASVKRSFLARSGGSATAYLGEMKAWYRVVE
jgi:hypothetical protein